MEEQSAARPPNKDICAMGAASIQDLLKQPGVQTTELEDPSVVGGKRTELIAPPGYVYTPKFIPDEQWRKNRAEFRERYAKVWAERYAKNAVGSSTAAPGARE
jgi:hypothetical protein